MARKADDPTVRQRAQVHSRRVVGEGDEHFVLPGRVGEIPSRELGQRRRVGCGRSPGRDRAERTREGEGRHTEIAVEGDVHIADPVHDAVAASRQQGVRLCIAGVHAGPGLEPVGATHRELVSTDGRKRDSSSASSAVATPRRR